MKYNGITIFKNKTCSTWYARYRLNGKQNYVSGKTQKQVYNKLKEIFQKEKPKEIKTFDTWYKTWLEVYKQGKVKKETIMQYNASLKRLSISFKNTRLKDIKQLDIEKELNGVSEIRAKQKLYEFLVQIFKKAKDNEEIGHNPVTNIDKPKYERDRGQILERSDYIKFEEYCYKKGYNCLLFILYQGCRIGEALAITQKDIDLNNKTVSINKSLSYNDKSFVSTKNKQSIRVAPLFEKSIELIKSKSYRIFDFTRMQIYEQLRDVKLYCKLKENFRVSDLRHTFISVCRAENIPEHIVQSWVGHKIGSKVTSKTYTHVSQDANLLYYNKLNKSKFYSNSTHFFTENKNDDN